MFVLRFLSSCGFSVDTLYTRHRKHRAQKALISVCYCANHGFCAVGICFCDLQCKDLVDSKGNICQFEWVAQKIKWINKGRRDPVS